MAVGLLSSSVARTAPMMACYSAFKSSIQSLIAFTSAGAPGMVWATRPALSMKM